MSWSTYGRVKAGWIDYKHKQVEGAEAVEQQFAAEKAMLDILDAGVLGDPNGTYNFNITGHANAGHLPKAGWVNDCVTISITQMEDTDE